MADRATTMRRPRSICARSRTRLVAEIDGALSTAEADELARRHGLERIASQNFPLLGGTIGLFRIVDRRPVDTVRRELAADGSVRSVQLNFRYFLQDAEEARDRGRRRAIRRRPASAAAGARARPRHERHHRGDRFRYRRQTSRTRQFGRRQFRRARQQRRSACPRHRHCRRDRRACQADGQRAGGEAAGDPRVRRGIEGRGEHVLCDPEGTELRGRAWRADHQHELCRPEGSADRAGHCRDRGAAAS